MSLDNLERMFALADETDLREGELAYTRYRAVMEGLADMYRVPLDRVVAAFCALSPNNDYTGNLRSVVSVLEGFTKGYDRHSVVVSTYNHCKLRAWEYVDGSVTFLDRARGEKIRAFYHNIMDPTDPRYVTIDGHMVAIWRGQKLTMKDALVRGTREYADIVFGVKQLAFRQLLVPCQVQAILWFVRKRVFKVVYQAQLELLTPNFEAWRTSRDVRSIEPFPPRTP